jgi:trehalose utilization protein
VSAREKRSIRVTVWGENLHEKRDASVQKIYPEGMHTTIAAGIVENLGDLATVRTVTLQDDQHGLAEDVLATTDVLTWWGHIGHSQVDDLVVERVKRRVLQGMGLVVLHSAHYSKLFLSLMGTSCDLQWRSIGERELVWTINPGHLIADGVPSMFPIEAQEMYGEFFDIPQPDELVFLSTFAGGEVFRSGCCFYRGGGRIFYFSPGDQEYPVYHHPVVRRVIANAVRWAFNDRSPKVQYRTKNGNLPAGWIEGFINGQ